MGVHKFDLKSLLGLVFRSTNKLSIKAVTRQNLPYFWGWIAVSVWLYAYFLPMGDFALKVSLFEEIVGDTTFYFYVMLISGSLIPFLFDGKKFVSASFYSVIVSLICFILVLFLGPGIPSKIIMLIAVPCIGHIFISHVYAFFMILNNSEKFYSMILVVLFPKVLMYIKPILSSTQLKLHPFAILIFFIMITLAFSTYFIKSHANMVPSLQKTKAPVKSYSLMPVIFIVFALNDVIAPATLQQISDFSKIQIESLYFTGILAGLAVILLLQTRLSMNLCIMLNLSFALLALGFVIDIARMQYPDAGLVSAVCFGAAYSIGIVNIYYLAGFMIKKFQSIYFYRTGFLLSSLCYLAVSIFVKIFGQSEILVPPILMAFVSICIIILFFILSPFFIKMLYSGEWIDDAYRGDISQCSRLEARLKDYKLTPAEMEVCRLLLDGYTLRQISGMQSKAYATINTYCTSIYRKLNINSRTELLMLLQEYKK
ncbi:helix-turn-helix transcriptional regulator [Intestinimonas butyriciproducens]|uniref:helix-turn-helix transcriptional regulator n=1 Tax=Intestinimonas butyriciproducens TaxID=1297617 RepID=UPI00051BF16F|nr:helix-turn-helix transcriptional regulator [Intestinimonas butyriciproducens]